MDTSVMEKMLRLVVVILAFMLFPVGESGNDLMYDKLETSILCRRSGLSLENWIREKNYYIPKCVFQILKWGSCCGKCYYLVSMCQMHQV